MHFSLLTQFFRLAIEMIANLKGRVSPVFYAGPQARKETTSRVSKMAVNSAGQTQRLPGTNMVVNGPAIIFRSRQSFEDFFSTRATRRSCSTMSVAISAACLSQPGFR